MTSLRDKLWAAEMSRPRITYMKDPLIQAVTHYETDIKIIGNTAFSKGEVKGVVYSLTGTHGSWQFETSSNVVFKLDTTKIPTAIQSVFSCACVVSASVTSLQLSTSEGILLFTVVQVIPIDRTLVLDFPSADVDTTYSSPLSLEAFLAPSPMTVPVGWSDIGSSVTAYMAEEDHKEVPPENLVKTENFKDYVKENVLNKDIRDLVRLDSLTFKRTECEIEIAVRSTTLEVLAHFTPNFTMKELCGHLCRGVRCVNGKIFVNVKGVFKWVGFQSSVRYVRGVSEWLCVGGLRPSTVLENARKNSELDWEEFSRDPIAVESTNEAVLSEAMDTYVDREQYVGNLSGDVKGYEATFYYDKKLIYSKLRPNHNGSVDPIKFKVVDEDTGREREVVIPIVVLMANISDGRPLLAIYLLDDPSINRKWVPVRGPGATSLSWCDSCSNHINVSDATECDNMAAEWTPYMNLKTNTLLGSQSAFVMTEDWLNGSKTQSRSRGTKYKSFMLDMLSGMCAQSQSEYTVLREQYSYKDWLKTFRQCGFPVFSDGIVEIPYALPADKIRVLLSTIKLRQRSRWVHTYGKKCYYDYKDSQDRDPADDKEILFYETTLLNNPGMPPILRGQRMTAQSGTITRKSSMYQVTRYGEGRDELFVLIEYFTDVENEVDPVAIISRGRTYNQIVMHGNLLGQMVVDLNGQWRDRDDDMVCGQE